MEIFLKAKNIFKMLKNASKVVVYLKNLTYRIILSSFIFGNLVP